MAYPKVNFKQLVSSHPDMSECTPLPRAQFKNKSNELEQKEKTHKEEHSLTGKMLIWYMHIKGYVAADS